MRFTNVNGIGTVLHGGGWTPMQGNEFRKGMRDGLPIALGYFAVAFSLGIAARGAGLTIARGWSQAF